MNNWISRNSVFHSSLAAILMGYLWFESGYPIMALPWNAHDDALFLRSLESILNGEWLGPYDNVTLAKGPLLPIIGAVSSGIGVSAKFLESVIYASTILMVALAARRFGISRLFTLTLVVLLLSSPHLWSDPGRRFLREILYSSFAVMALLMTVMMFSLRTRTTGGLCAFGIGAFLGLAYLTREEDIWILSGIAVVFVLGALRNTLRFGLASIPELLKTVLLRGVLVLSGLAAFVAPVLVSNGQHYDRAIVSEFRAPEFKAAIGSLMRIGDLHPSGYVPVPKATMDQVLDKIPAAQTLKPHWPALATQWSQYGAYLIPDYPGEVGGGWFVWAFRDAVSLAGHHASAQAARRFYSDLAAQVNAACEDGTLSCRARRDTLRPELTPARLPELIAASARALLYTVTLSSGPIAVPRSIGTGSSLDLWEHRIGPVVVQDFRFAGWVLHPAVEPTVIVPLETSDCSGKLTLKSAEDVESHFKAQGMQDVRAVRFEYVTSTYETRCEIAVVSPENLRLMLPLSAIGPGPIDIPAPFQGYLDNSPTSDASFSPRPHEGLMLMFLLSFIYVTRIAVPILVVTATVGIVSYLWGARRQYHYDWLVILSVGAAALVVARCAIIGYIEIASWRAINSGYLGPAYPFVIIYAVAGTTVLRNVLRQKGLRLQRFGRAI